MLSEEACLTLFGVESPAVSYDPWLGRDQEVAGRLAEALDEDQFSLWGGDLYVNHPFLIR